VGVHGWAAILQANWNNLAWYTNLLLSDITGLDQYKQKVLTLLNSYVYGNSIPTTTAASTTSSLVCACTTTCLAAPCCMSAGSPLDPALRACVGPAGHQRPHQLH
jgi:hypothetical protein